MRLRLPHSEVGRRTCVWRWGNSWTPARASQAPGCPDLRNGGWDNPRIHSIAIRVYFACHVFTPSPGEIFTRFFPGALYYPYTVAPPAHVRIVSQSLHASKPGMIGKYFARQENTKILTVPYSTVGILYQTGTSTVQYNRVPTGGDPLVPTRIHALILLKNSKTRTPRPRLTPHRMEVFITACI